MKKLLIIPTLFILSCSQTKYIEKPIYLKCQIPEVPKTQKPTLNNEMSYPEKLQNILNYMFDLEKENELLREAIKICNN
jgi:DNA polymerase III delta prime subunit